MYLFSNLCKDCRIVKSIARNDSVTLKIYTFSLAFLVDNIEHGLFINNDDKLALADTVKRGC